MNNIKKYVLYSAKQRVQRIKNYEVCCSERFLKIRFSSENCKHYKFGWCVLLKYYLLLIFNPIIPYQYSTYICSVIRLCPNCVKKRVLRYQFYHLSDRKQYYRRCLQYYFNDYSNDFDNLLKKTMYEYEIDLREDFTQKYFNGVMDYGHRKWVDNLSNYIISSKRFSNHYWNESKFLSRDRYSWLDYYSSNFFKNNILEIRGPLSITFNIKSEGKLLDKYNIFYNYDVRNEIANEYLKIQYGEEEW